VPREKRETPDVLFVLWNPNPHNLGLNAENIHMGTTTKIDEFIAKKKKRI